MARICKYVGTGPVLRKCQLRLPSIFGVCFVLLMISGTAQAGYFVEVLCKTDRYVKDGMVTHRCEGEGMKFYTKSYHNPSMVYFSEVHWDFWVFEPDDVINGKADGLCDAFIDYHIQDFPPSGYRPKCLETRMSEELNGKIIFFNCLKENIMWRDKDVADCIGGEHEAHLYKEE